MRALRATSRLLTTLLLTGASVATSQIASTSAAYADDDEALKEARAKFQRAIELEHAKDFRSAVKLFREVGQVRMTPQIRYHIASCEEALGKLVIAMGGYELALAQSEGMHPDFVSEVQGSIDDLKARIPKLVLERGEGAEAATIELDGTAVGANSIGEEMQLDPGPHSVTATSPGFRNYRQTVTVDEGQVEVLQIQMEELPDGQAQVAVSEDGSGEKKGYGALPYIIGGAGIAVAGVGGLFIGLSGGKVNQAEEICGGGTDCTGLPAEDQLEAERLANSASTFEAVGWASVAVGGAALVTGTVLFIIDPGRKAKSDASAGLSFVPSAPRSDAGFSLVGRF